jgi:homoserine kinase
MKGGGKKSGAGARARTITVRVPASSANLGAGFDCFGLALGLYLDVRARVVAGQSQPCRVKYSGEGADLLPPTADNLIYRAALHLSEREGFRLPPLALDVKNDIPLGRGLGSSAAAIVAGVLIGASFAPRRVVADRLFACAAEIEGHADNVAAALYGGWTVAFGNALPSDRALNARSADRRQPQNGVEAVRRPWPRRIHAVVVSPETQTDTHASRKFLRAEVRRADAVFNLQRVALFSAAIESGRTELLWEAMRDRLHQPQRVTLVPGLAEALQIPRQPGLLGIALSGSGPSVIALASGQTAQIGAQIAAAFAKQSIRSTVRVLAAGVSGAQLTGRPTS